MIDLARAQEKEQGPGIEYEAGDVRGLDLGMQHDLAIAAYLLNYARDQDELLAICEGIARCLKPGGRFVTVNSSPMLDYQNAPCYRHYGFEVHAVGGFREGMPVTWTFFVEDGAFDIENYFLDVSVHEEALRAAGFRKIDWHTPRAFPGWRCRPWQGLLDPFYGSPAYCGHRMQQVKSGNKLLYVRENKIL